MDELATLLGAFALLGPIAAIVIALARRHRSAAAVCVLAAVPLIFQGALMVDLVASGEDPGIGTGIMIVLLLPMGVSETLCVSCSTKFRESAPWFVSDPRDEPMPAGGVPGPGGIP